MSRGFSKRSNKLLKKGHELCSWLNGRIRTVTKLLVFCAVFGSKPILPQEARVLNWV